MRNLAGLLTIAAFVTSCSSMQTLGRHQFTTHEGLVDGRSNIPDHGFMQVEPNEHICDGNNRLSAGYAVKIRKPNSGETQSEYTQYVEAEKVRVSLCSKVALWCSTHTPYFCKPNDEACLKERPRTNRNTCAVKVLDARNKPHLWPITISLNQETWIECARTSDDYESSLAYASVSNKAWVKDQPKWVQFCEQLRPKEECELIIQNFETPTWFVWPDASRWAVDILHKDKVEVVREGDYWVGSTQVDLTPACMLFENRY